MRLFLTALILFVFILNKDYQVFAQAASSSNVTGTNTGTIIATSISNTAAPASSSSPPLAVVSGNQTLSNNNQTVTASNNGTQNDSLGGLPTSASFGNTVFPGGASFIKPTASKSVSPLYRIDNRENVTFIWTFTDLKVAPVNLTLAAVAPNKVTYTISTLPGHATSAVWQIKDVPTASPLMMGMYQVQLYDQRGVSANPQPGWLAPNTRLTIAFYSPETYQAGTGSDYCPACFYNASRKMAESLGPMIIAVGLAGVTSAMILWGLLF
ncbi:uncharacterized protein BX663DRAFT_511248 [Cokeromyces recurvatus]|uniref:uncharacterized protein n=1 Tax=Cokeromyces recurvatus TaxID=90255 RepID=UPI0022210F8E|nr:uncharacterized protein BX663DRAFT_511248 [Cokeromyces recurvatus]KAI7902495.1 hypothetical protein BX663DRAFT_511248 [Cokeromyces recurvatus]